MLSKSRTTLLEIMYKAKDYIINSLKMRQPLTVYEDPHILSVLWAPAFYLYFEWEVDVLSGINNPNKLGNYILN